MASCEEEPGGSADAQKHPQTRRWVSKCLLSINLCMSSLSRRAPKQIKCKFVEHSKGNQKRVKLSLSKQQFVKSDQGTIRGLHTVTFVVLLLMKIYELHARKLSPGVNDSPMLIHHERVILSQDGFALEFIVCRRFASYRLFTLCLRLNEEKMLMWH